MPTEAQKRAISAYKDRKQSEGYKNLQVLLTPENHAKLERLTERYGISKAEAINRLIEKA